MCSRVLPFLGGAMSDANNSSDQPPKKRQKVACHVNELADKELLSIFKQLPPNDRLIVSEVCKRWHELSRLPWRDVIQLDLWTVRGNRIGAVIKQCPNLQSIFARRIDLDFYVRVLSRTSLSSLRLYDCYGGPDEDHIVDDSFDLFLALFSDRLPNASWDELVLHNLDLRVDVSSSDSCYGCPIVGTLPVSLKRLQLSGDLKITFEGSRGVWQPSGEGLLNGLLSLRNLTCLILCSSSRMCLIEPDLSGILADLEVLTNLVELCATPEVSYGIEFTDFVDLAFKLPKLEVLFVNGIACDSSDESLKRVATKHPTLRILVITGYVQRQQTIPARILYPDGFASDPLPLLHVFLGRHALREIQFEELTSDAAKIYQITEPLPAFLEKEEIAPIFDGVWIAAQIKEGAKHSANLWEYDA